MKKLMNIVFALVLGVLTTFLSPVIAQARTGNGVGNGGDVAALEFTWLARIALHRLEISKLTANHRETIAKLKAAIDSTRVVIVDELVLREQVVDAINYPTVGLIQVRRGGWAQIKHSTPTTRLAFVLHEYLGIAEVDDHQYQTSKKLVELMFGERSSDIASQEHLLDSILSLKLKLYGTFHAVRTSKTRKSYNPRKVCVLAGYMAGQNSVMSLVISNPRPWFIGQTPDEDLSELSQVAATLQDMCNASKIDMAAFQNAVGRAMKAVARLCPEVLPPLDIYSTIMMPLEK